MLASDYSIFFVGIYRFAGTLGDSNGSFLLEARGSNDIGGLSQGTWSIVQNSGTGKLAGLKGNGMFSHLSRGLSSISLEYEL